MSIKNRISVIIDPLEAAEYKAAEATQKRLLLKWLKNANLDEVKPGNYMGTEGGWRYCQNGYKFATDHPKVYDPEELDYEEYGKDFHAAEFFIEADRENAQTDALRGIALILVGKDLMEQTHHVRQRANAKRDKNLDYVAPSDKLNEMYEKRNEKAEETKKANEQINDLKEQLAALKSPT
jgi:hypothetical protein